MRGEKKGATFKNETIDREKLFSIVKADKYMRLVISKSAF